MKSYSINCEIDINECLPNPCLNQASCVDAVASYACICQPGYTGTNCEVEIDECEDHRCENGATCIDLLNRYALSGGLLGDIMRREYRRLLGSQLHQRSKLLDGVPAITVTALRRNPCKNGGVCGEDGGIRYCSCLVGFSGSLCEENIDDCIGSARCENGGECIDLVNDYFCECREGFSGDHCEMDGDDCVDEPCYNHATCVDGLASFACLCPPAFSGELCEEFINPCEVQPCRNGGSCTTLVLLQFVNAELDSKLPGDADLKFETSGGADLLFLDGIYEEFDFTFLKLGYWFRATGHAGDFVLFEYTPINATEADLKVYNISHIKVELFG
ncbi:hypothetical protein BSL78_07553 [Apostichopus japonicus]|uniref:EGF-like domain-containing protein n=1 Tax=Stichopus japonicus TaxID=307972 RepID=A0A2G8L5M7_STIJA|nr:hypothetical protein BSL78_07553 [Apostichopus japonicus]